MTGGIGFSRTGQNSVKQNKSLLSPRSRMKDNPYVPFDTINREQGVPNYEKLKSWKIKKNESEKKIKRIIYMILFTALILFLVIVKMIN